MAMIAARRGSRPSNVKIIINEKLIRISFSPGFLRKHQYDSSNTKYVRIGYDKETKEIGLEFIGVVFDNNEAMKLTYTKYGSSASCPIRSLLTSASLKINQISGTYGDSAIVGPQKIEGFSDNGFIIKVDRRE
jgi:hypothetical protein